jgi:predicted nuclease of predicted toxin-antitoxin system
VHFLLDQNVAKAVADMLVAEGHTCEFSRALIPADAADPLVAIAAEETGAILVSHDTDFNTIAARIVKGHKNRFRKLSRVALQCSEPEAAARLCENLPILQVLVAQADSRPDKRVILFIQKFTIRTA